MGSSSSGAPAPSSSGALVLGSSGAPVPATPLLSQSGVDVFAAIVPLVRSSFGFMKKKIAERVIPCYVSLLLFSFFLTHILIVEFPYLLAGPRLPLTLH